MSGRLEVNAPGARTLSTIPVTSIRILATSDSVFCHLCMTAAGSQRYNCWQALGKMTQPSLLKDLPTGTTTPLPRSTKQAMQYCREANEVFNLLPQKVCDIHSDHELLSQKYSNQGGKQGGTGVSYNLMQGFLARQG